MVRAPLARGHRNHRRAELFRVIYNRCARGGGLLLATYRLFLVAQSLAPGARMRSVNMHVFLRSRRSFQILSIKGSSQIPSRAPSRPRAQGCAIGQFRGQRTALAGAAAAAGRPGPREQDRGSYSAVPWLRASTSRKRSTCAVLYCTPYPRHRLRRCCRRRSGALLIFTADITWIYLVRSARLSSSASPQPPTF